MQQDAEGKVVIVGYAEDDEAIKGEDLAAFRAKMEPARQRIAAFGGEANVKKFLEIVEKARN